MTHRVGITHGMAISYQYLLNRHSGTHRRQYVLGRRREAKGNSRDKESPVRKGQEKDPPPHGSRIHETLGQGGKGQEGHNILPQTNSNVLKKKDAGLWAIRKNWWSAETTVCGR